MSGKRLTLFTPSYLKHPPAPFRVRRSSRYEPYLLLPACSRFYDERFAGYGKNKISFIQTLRHSGARFNVLGGAFLTHVEHGKSRDKRRWEDDAKLHRDVDRDYDAFMKEVYSKWGNKPVVKLCHLK